MVARRGARGPRAADDRRDALDSRRPREAQARARRTAKSRSRLGRLESYRDGTVCSDRRQQGRIELFHFWSKGSSKYDDAKTGERWSALHTCPPTNIGAGTIFFKASAACPGWDRLTTEHFYSYLPKHDYIFLPTGGHWPGSSVNATVAKVPLVDASGNPLL